jgi:hypothetical protein
MAPDLDQMREPPERAIHCPWKYSLQLSCTCSLRCGHRLDVFWSPICCGVRLLFASVSAFSRNVTQNRYSRSRQTTTTR